MELEVCTAFAHGNGDTILLMTSERIGEGWFVRAHAHFLVWAKQSDAASRVAALPLLHVITACVCESSLTVPFFLQRELLNYLLFFVYFFSAPEEMICVGKNGLFLNL